MHYVGGPDTGFEGIDGWARAIMEADERFENGMRTLIVGHGVVGTNLGAELSALRPEFRDKRRGEEASGHFDLTFVCVDTPATSETPCDVSEVWNAVAENDADTYVIMSTVPVGTTDEAAAKTGKDVVFSTEYYGGTQHCNRFEFDFTILGGDREACARVQQALQRIYDGRHAFKITGARTAELSKYMENA